jgi:hypothetical protein
MPSECGNGRLEAMRAATTLAAAELPRQQPGLPVKLPHGSTPAAPMYDLRNAETFYDRSSAPQTRAIGEAYAPPQMVSAGAGVPLTRLPQGLAQPLTQPLSHPLTQGGLSTAMAQPLVSEEGGYECPPRLNGVTLQDAPGRFLPSPPPGPLEVKTKAKELQLEVKLGLKYLERTIKALRTGESKMQRKILAHHKKGCVSEMHMVASSIVQSRRSSAVLETYKGVVQDAYQDLAGCNAALKFSSPVDVCMATMSKMEAIMRTHEVQTTLSQMQREMASRIDERCGADHEPTFHQQGSQVSPNEIQRVLEEIGCVL